LVGDHFWLSFRNGLDCILRIRYHLLWRCQKSSGPYFASP